MRCLGTWNPETPKPLFLKSQNAGPTLPLSHLRKLFVLDVWLLKSRDSETRNPKVLSFSFLHFGNWFMPMLLRHLNPRISEILKPRSTSPTFPLFRILEIFTCRCLTSVFAKSRTTGHFSRFRELSCADLRFWIREISNSEIPKMWVTFRNFRICSALTLLVVIAKSRTPKHRHVGHIFTISGVDVCRLENFVSQLDI